jgi:transcriptional regulator with XRE-family HTH domain
MAPRKTPSQRGTNVIGPRIRLARERMSPEVTQADLAARLGVAGLDVDRWTITRIESGKRYLRDYEIKAIAKVLKVSIEWLFSDG